MILDDLERPLCTLLHNVFFGAHQGCQHYFPKIWDETAARPSPSLFPLLLPSLPLSSFPFSSIQFPPWGPLPLPPDLSSNEAKVTRCNTWVNFSYFFKVTKYFNVWVLLTCNEVNFFKFIITFTSLLCKIRRSLQVFFQEVTLLAILDKVTGHLVSELSRTMFTFSIRQYSQYFCLAAVEGAVCENGCCFTCKCCCRRTV